MTIDIIDTLQLCWVSCFICCYAECHYAECGYAECHYDKCRYADCRGAPLTILPLKQLGCQLLISRLEIFWHQFQKSKLFAEKKSLWRSFKNNDGDKWLKKTTAASFENVVKASLKRQVVERPIKVMRHSHLTARVRNDKLC